MNWDRIEGNWNQFSGQARARWGKLTDDQWSRVGGRKDDLIGRIQEAYGIGREEAERQVHEWSAGLADDGTSGSGASGTGGMSGSGTGGMGGSGMGGMGGSGMGGMGDFGEQAGRWAEEARQTAQAQAEQLAEQIRQKPLGAIAAAAGIGLVIGLLLGR